VGAAAAELVAAGLSSKQAAAQLCRSVTTVDTHLRGCAASSASAPVPSSPGARPPASLPASGPAPPFPVKDCPFGRFNFARANLP